MKLKASLFIIIGLLCIGVIVFAIFKAVPASAPAKPAVTQQAIKNKLSKNAPQKPKPSQPASKPPSPSPNPTPSKTSANKSASQASKPASAAKSGQLSNTGPGQTILLFGVATVIGYALRLSATMLAYRRTAEN